MAGALDLAPGAMGHTRRQQEVTLDGAPAQGLAITGQRGGDGGVAREQAGPGQAGDQRLGVVEGRVLPGGA